MRVPTNLPPVPTVELRVSSYNIQVNSINKIECEVSM